MGKTDDKFASELDEYIANTKNRLSAILCALDWNEVDTLKESTCSGHSKLKKQKDDPCDPLLPESFESMHSMVIDEEKLKDILDSNTVSIPKKFSDIQLNFSREQKLTLYDYVVQNTGKISEPELKVSLLQGANEVTFAEIVAKAKKKDKQLKRKYRTSKPTHTEEVRNLVHLQMQALAQYFNPKPPRDEKYAEAGCSGLSRGTHKRSRSRSRDRRRSRPDRDLSRSRHRISDEHSKDRKIAQSHHDDRSKKHSKKKSKKHSKSKHKSSKSKKSKHHRKSKKSND